MSLRVSILSCQCTNIVCQNYVFVSKQDVEPGEDCFFSDAANAGCKFMFSSIQKVI